MSQTAEFNARGTQSWHIRLWTGVLGPPIVWLIQFQARYSLVQWACAHHNNAPLYLLSIVSFAAAAALALLSWRSWERTGKAWPSETSGIPTARSQFLAVLGLFSSVMFGLVILAQAVPMFFINPCQD